MLRGFGNAIVVFYALLAVTNLLWEYGGRPQMERWLYGCNDEFNNIQEFTMYGLPPVSFIDPTREVFWHQPGDHCHILYFHGRGRSLRHNLWYLAKLYKSSKCSITAFEYPSCAYGNNNNLQYTSTELLNKARDAIQFNLSGNGKNYLMGASFGCSILLTAIQNQDLTLVIGIILENPPTSMVDVATDRIGGYPFLWRPYLAKQNDWAVWDGLDAIPSHCETLILTSERDELIPSSVMSKAIVKHLYERGRHVIQVILEGANHGDAPAHIAHTNAVIDFITH